MTTHQEALETGAAIEAKWDGRDFTALGRGDKQRYTDRFADGVRAYLTTLAPADNGLVERLRNGPVTIGKATGEILELRQAADAITTLQAEIAGLREGEARLSLLLNERAQELSEAGSEIERLKAERDEARSTLTAIQEARHAGN